MLEKQYQFFYIPETHINTRDRQYLLIVGCLNRWNPFFLLNWGLFQLINWHGKGIIDFNLYPLIISYCNLIQQSLGHVLSWLSKWTLSVLVGQRKQIWWLLWIFLSFLIFYLFCFGLLFGFLLSYWFWLLFFLFVGLTKRER